jgi:hypothetical protein
MTTPNPSFATRVQDPSRIRLTPATVTGELGRLTDRDQWILTLLDEHKVFTTEQLTEVAFGALGRARNRLNTLHQRGVLDRFRHLVRPGSQSWRWTLGPVGAAILAAGRDQPPPRPGSVREATMRLAASPQLPHRLGVNGFFTTLHAHARHHTGMELAGWWSEARARRATGDLARPDAAGLWQEAGRRVAFWLEYDRGTEPVRSRLAGKLDDYANLAGTKWAFPLLFWLPTAARESHLHTALTAAGPVEGLLVATTHDQLAQARGGPAGPVWLPVGQTTRLRLADLPTTRGDHTWGG